MRVMENNICERIKDLFDNYQDVLFGFSDASFSDYADKYKGVLVFAVPHSKFLKIEDYQEQAFDAILRETRERAKTIQREIELILLEENSEYELPPASQKSEETLAAPLSFKYAAVSARLGWIGKNDMLITEKYGPRVTLSAVLINFDFPVTSPILVGKCPEGCLECVTACPYNALKGKQWNINAKRSEIIDYQLCNQKRRLYIELHNRKHACGYCMLACPYGSRQ